MDKREGSVIYDAVAPVAAELAQAYIQMDALLDAGFADTAVGKNLDRRASERGILRRRATAAVRKAALTGAIVPVGVRFSGDDLNFEVSEKISEGEYKLTCETPGDEGNRYKGVLYPIDYIEGFSSAVMTDILIPGEDEEGDDAFRKRYFDSFQSQAFGGNVADYKARVDSLPGVGGVKVYPAKNGAGTVGLVIVNSDYDVPSTSLIEQVQNEVDPPESAGKGTGIAPIGHVVTVSGVTAAPVNIASTITYASGWSFSEAKALIESAIDGYFKELAEAWADEP
ncbi:MAG: baseplate J/gp47 family protein, partial [Bacillota bacterium]|nr:baseplate J/gp47 family protein [Bacillota bacterium]